MNELKQKKSQSPVWIFLYIELEFSEEQQFFLSSFNILVFYSHLLGDNGYVFPMMYTKYFFFLLIPFLSSIFPSMITCMSWYFLFRIMCPRYAVFFIISKLAKQKFYYILYILIVGFALAVFNIVFWD